MNHQNWKLLDQGDDCGYSAADRIIGGTVARLGQYPWLARVGFKSKYTISYGDYSLLTSSVIFPVNIINELSG